MDSSGNSDISSKASNDAGMVIQDIATDSSLDISYSSAIKLEESDSEYESAVESVVSETVNELVERFFDNIEVSQSNILDVIRDEIEDGQDSTITYTSPSKVSIDEEG